MNAIHLRPAACVLMIFLLFAADIARADALPEGPMGGVQFGSSGNGADIAREVVEVSKELITVDYFLRPERTSYAVEMLLPLPSYSGEGPWPSPAGQPKLLKILIDGQSTSPRTTVTARQQGKDVTKELHRLGLTDRQIAFFPGDSPFHNAFAEPLSTSQRNSLVKAGLLEYNNVCGGLCLGWETQATYVWNVGIPAGHATHVHVEYSPMSAEGGDTDFLDKDELVNVYCATAQDLGTWQAAVWAGGDQHWLSAANLTYILADNDPTASAITDFTLRIKKDGKGELVEYCFPGTREQVSPTVEEIHLHNYVPVGSIRVRFGNLVHPRDNPEDDYDAPVVP